MTKIVSVLLTMAVAVLLTACMTAPPAAPVTQAADVPDFFLSPPILEDQFVGLGLAKLSDTTLSRRTALARARADIATQVSVSVETMLIDYSQEAGSGNDTQTIEFVEAITREVADIQLQGAVTAQQYQSDDGTWYVMVYFPKNALIEEVGELFERNESAAFAEFKADQALERLDAEVENNPPRSVGSDSPANSDS